MMPMKTKCAAVRVRRGFTLIELLVVMSIIVLLAAMALLFMPKADKRAATRGADQLQTYIASAKSRALRDNAPRGVRLLSEDNGVTFREFQFVEVPEPYAPNVAMTIPKSPANNQATLTMNFTDLFASIQIGDMLEIVQGSGSIHRVTALTGNASSCTVTLASGVPLATTTDLTISQNYRFIRQPRPLMGEPTLKLPDRIFVYANSASAPGSVNIPSSYPNPNANPATYYEILFSPSGQVINAQGGRIVLWVADDNNISPPTLLTIYTRTGGVAAHPQGPAGNEYLFTQDGKSSGQ